MPMDIIAANILVMIAIVVFAMGLINLWDLFIEKREETGASSWRTAWLMIFGFFTAVVTLGGEKSAAFWQPIRSLIER